MATKATKKKTNTNELTLMNAQKGMFVKRDFDRGGWNKGYAHSGCTGELVEVEAEKGYVVVAWAEPDGPKFSNNLNVDEHPMVIQGEVDTKSIFSID